MSTSILQRFWDKVTIGDGGECWNWRCGPYPQFRLDKNTTVFAHRLSWILHNKHDIPPGKQINHNCDNPYCVNPAHLYMGTQFDNCQDRYRNPNWGKNHSRGINHYDHRLTEDNVIEIRKLSKTGLSHQRIGNKYGVSKRTIFKIIHRMTWKHVP